MSDKPGRAAQVGTQAAFTRLARFAAHHSPLHAERAWAAFLRAGRPVALADIPLLEKSAVQTASSHLIATRAAPGHEIVSWDHTSGSTGQPLAVLKSRRQLMLEDAESMRLKASWHSVASGPHLTLDGATPARPKGTLRERYGADGAPVWHLYGVEIEHAVAFMRERQVVWLHTWPSVVRGLLEVCREHGAPHTLRAISTRAEILPAALRAAAADAFGWRVLDVYGAAECGAIAAECARCGAYHLAHGSCLIEVLRDDGAPVEPGERGEVVVTPLYGYAMPLLRYRLGDVAELGPSTPCSGGLPTLRAILGRDRHVFRTQDGRRFVPMLEARAVNALRLRRYKLVQPAPGVIEVWYIPEPGQRVDEARLAGLVRDCLPGTFSLTVREVAAIPPAPSGKYFMHERLWDDAR